MDSSSLPETFNMKTLDNEIEATLSKVKTLRYSIELTVDMQQKYAFARDLKSELEKLKTNIKNYINLEREHNLPINLKYRAIYKALNSRR